MMDIGIYEQGRVSMTGEVNRPPEAGAPQESELQEGDATLE
jgi:hypothetical protein